MKRFPVTITFILILLAIYWVFRSSTPTYKVNSQISENTFSTDRALRHVEAIAQQPHGVGFVGHAEVQNYILGELRKMGLETRLQDGYTAGDGGNFSRATNILARIKGTGTGKALMLLSHYDSSPHSSLGASDAGSGVATILEALRAYLTEQKSAKNDIIVLFSDAEELGLNGADLFVNQHPWTKEVGLVLNFEARGSGGPSYMLIETNRGNARLIEEFTKADPDYPVANSLAYSIYKMLPNDTDLTVFREDADIEGFNFAFIDDHFDYHTVRDNYDRLDRKTLAHQGSYLMPLLLYFSNSDLANLKSLNDLVYFNMPFFKLVSYPYDWIWAMFGLAVMGFILLMIHGFRKKVLNGKEILLGFLPWLIAFSVNGAIGYFAWPLLKWLYPQYNDILQGFTYNGYTYIAAFTLLSTAICFWAYHKFKSIGIANLLVTPIFIWLLICGAVSIFLQGASFFIIPVFGLLASFLVIINQKEPSPYLLVFLALPAIWIHVPLIKMLPVGLGLKMLVGSTLSVTNLFLLMLPIFGFYQKKNRFAFLGCILFFVGMVVAHYNSDFTKESAKPSSLLYVLDADNNKAQWATYDQVLIPWNEQFLGKGDLRADVLETKAISSKYNSGFSYVAEAPAKDISPPLIETTRDTIIGKVRMIEICITPERNVNRLEVYTNGAPVISATINGVPLGGYYLEHRKKGKLFTHYISDNAHTEIQLGIPKDGNLELILYEASNDLLVNPQFSIPERPENSIPMPFVLNDAILITKTIKIE